MEDYMSLCCMVHKLSWGTISMASLPYVRIINTLILLNRGVSVGVGWGPQLGGVFGRCTALQCGGLWLAILPDSCHALLSEVNCLLQLFMYLEFIELDLCWEHYVAVLVPFQFTQKSGSKWILVNWRLNWDYSQSLRIFQRIHNNLNN